MDDIAEGVLILEGFSLAAEEITALTAESAAALASEAPAEEMVTGYRAVCSAECQDLLGTGTFNLSTGGVESKYFSDTLEQAESFGKRMYGSGKYGIVQGDFSDLLYR